MNVLHILNDGPCEDAQFIIDQQSGNHDIRIIDLSHDEIDYVELVEQLEQCDKVFSW